MTSPVSRSPHTTQDTAESLLGFLRARTKKDWRSDQDLFEATGLSSLFAMELVVYLEQSFGIEVVGADLRLDNFRTVDAMVALVVRLHSERDGGLGAF